MNALLIKGDIVLDFTLLKVRKNANRFKRPLEKVYIYPYPFEISGMKYFLVDYLQLRQVKGTAVVSTELKHENDARKAFRYLYQFYRLSEKIQSEGKVRANVHLTFFRTPLQVMDEYPNEKWHEGYSFIKELLAYQLTYRKTYDDFWNHLQQLEKDKMPLTEKELDLAIYTAAKLEAIERHIVYIIYKNVYALRDWIKGMEEAGLWDEFKNDIKAFYMQLTQNENVMRQEARKIKHENIDIAIKIMQKEMKHYMSFKRRRDEEVLRYPPYNKEKSK